MLPRFVLLLFAAAFASAACESPIDSEKSEPRLLIVSTEDGSSDIYSILPDGSGSVRLTRDPVVESCPRWSRDRRRIAYVATRDSALVRGHWVAAPAVFVMRSDGSEPVRVTTPVPGYATGCPDWSPDGTRLTYGRFSPDSDRFSVYLINADGSGERRLTFDPGDQLFARWSPDGTIIAFLSNDQTWSRINLVDADGSDRRAVPSPCIYNVGDLAWSPDGTRLAFTCDGSFGTEILTSRLDGTDVTRISAPTGPEAYGYDFGPVWSPDGQRIAFSRQSPSTAIDVYTVSGGGGAERRVTRLAGTEIVSDWR